MHDRDLKVQGVTGVETFPMVKTSENASGPLTKIVHKPILLVDFDGVIHSYNTGWHGATVIGDPPVPGAIQWLWDATNHFQVNIFSSRSHELGGVSAMMSYICAHAVHVFGDPEKAMRLLGELKFPKEKPPAFLSIDDRALTFEGDWSQFDPKSLLQFKPWNKRS